MKKKVFNLILIVLLTIFTWFLSFKYPNYYLQKSFTTFIALTVVYIIFKFILQKLVIKNVKGSKIKYSLKKLFSILNLLVFLIVLITIWVKDPKSLLVAYGIIGAGIAITLQDFFRNILGGILIFVNRLYSIGDRVEINSQLGDIIDIGVLYTTLLEIQNWVDGDQTTGRLMLVPNGYILSSGVKNYTKDHDFIWDEIRIPLTYDSDWKKASKLILNIVKKETSKVIKEANKDIKKLESKYYFGKRSTEPNIFIKLTDNWIMFNIRYITGARERRILNNSISQKILEILQKEKKIKIASTTIDIVGFPGKK